MLNTVRRFSYSKYWGILYVEHCGKIYLHKILRNILYVEHCGKIYLHKYWGILYVEHCGKIYLHKILYVEHCGKIYLHKIVRNTVRWKLWEDLFTQNTEEYCMLNTMRRFIYRKYWGILYVEHCGKIYLHKYWGILYVEHCGKIYIHKYWGILYVEHCGKIYLHKIVRNTVCWKLWEDLFTQNTEEYCMLNTMRKFIYTKY